MNLLTAASAVEGRLVGNDVDFERVVTDSRDLSGGELFVALKGENFDGHKPKGTNGFGVVLLLVKGGTFGAI